MRPRGCWHKPCKPLKERPGSGRRKAQEGQRRRPEDVDGSSSRKEEEEKEEEEEEGDGDREGRGHQKSYPVKPDPDDPNDPEGDGSSKQLKFFDIKARRRSKRRRLLVRHAQEQLDRGCLLEAEGDQAGMTSGIKISTYFALLIRPFHQTNNALLRELYGLAQTIDLLRSGRLPETADALAARFIAVHTALTDGGWTAASQLELYPLEPASVATMLQAHKHRRLIQKSQGLQPGRWGRSSRDG